MDEDELITSVGADNPEATIEKIYKYVSSRDLSDLTRRLDLDLSSGKYAAAFHFLCTKNGIKSRIIYGVTKMRQSYLPGKPQ